MTKSLTCLLGATFALAQIASATPQPLLGTSNALTLSQGVFEQENRILWGHNHDTDAVSFSHELEYGVTDNLEVAAYLSEWSWEKGAGSTWESAGVEAVYAFTNPTKDALGAALAVEAQFGNNVWVIEPQLRLQKNFGPVALIANLVFADEFVKRGVDSQEFAQSFGITYEINPSLFVGAEINHATVYEDWSHGVDEWFAGPAIHFRTKSFWATLGVQFQLSADESDAADVVVGTKFGFLF